MSAIDPAAADIAGERAGHSDSRALDGLALALAALALAAAIAACGWLPAWCLPWCATPALFAGCALPLIARWSPDPPELLKLATFTLALSPALAGSVWIAWHGFLDARSALAATAATWAALHLLALRRRVRVASGSRMPRVIAAVALALSCTAGCLLLRGNAVRFVEPALTRAAVAMAVDRLLPPMHPWLAGEPWTHAWSADALAAFTMRALNVAPTFACALFTVTAALIAPLSLYLLASALFSDARRSAIAVALALSAGAIPWSRNGAASIALDPFLVPGTGALAIAVSIAGLACAAHALRHGRRPWVGLCALCFGSALCLEFESAWPAALATLLAALSPACNAHARPRLLLALVVGSLPALFQARALARLPAVAESPPSLAWVAGLLVWFGLGSIGSVIAWREDTDRRAILVLCGLTAAVAMSSEIFAPTWTNSRAAASLAFFALAIPTAALVEARSSRARLRVIAGRAVGAALIFWGAWGLVRTCGSLWNESKREDPLLGESACALEPVSSEASAVDLRAALAFLRADARLRKDRAVLLACPANNPYRNTRDLPDRALAACAGLALYGDTRSKTVSGDAQFQPRLEELLRLFRDEAGFDPTLMPRLEHAGARAVVALVRDEDRAINPRLYGNLTRLGFERWKDFGGVALFLGPRAAAARYASTP